jgi:dolichol-phosphate mannosyltransferase
MENGTNSTTGALIESPDGLGNRLAEIRVLTPLSIVVPTYKEVESLPYLLERIDALRIKYDLTLELLVMDDKSGDGSVELVEQSGHEWARIIVREGPRGLSPAVLDGIRLAK